MSGGEDRVQAVPVLEIDGPVAMQKKWEQLWGEISKEVKEQWKEGMKFPSLSLPISSHC